MTDTAQPPSPVRRIIGLVLIAAGVLWIAASGLCTAAFFVTLFTESAPDVREVMSIAPMVILVGGFSIGIGLVLYIVGRALRPKT
jgi:hypothetical protein